MENGHKMRVAFVVASLAAITIFFTIRRRRRRQQKSPSSLCYLHAEQTPQYAFKRVLADNSYTPFKHLKLGDSSDENASNSHPFEAEITTLLKNPRPEIELSTEIMDLEMRETYVWVETELQLKELVNILSKESFFAVDTEQHSLRYLLGFTALVQISTQQKDYLVDTIALHDLMGILRPVFANPSICKVFHGADNDVVWLQRDFHIYVVNLFDTSKACEVLLKPQKSLAYLLETYCSVTTNKLLQHEDWRQRPLSAEMVHNARTDPHYLLYIANCLITELKQMDNENSCSDCKFHFVLEASRRSNTICLQLFTKEIEASPGKSAALSLFSHHVSGQGFPSISSETQFQNIVRQLCAWRDLMARIHDESLKYILSDQAIITLASQPLATHSEIYNIVAQADVNVEMGLTSFIPSPSPVVCSHLSDIYHLLANELVNHGDIYSVILQKCLGPNGSCPPSIFNYALLVNSNLRPTLAYKHSGPKTYKQVSRKASRDLFVQKFSCKSPIYHNCRIFANDGRLLCYCDRRKLEWYLSRDLAKLIDEDPPAIILLFEPKGRPEDEDNDFYIQSKKNICVGCDEGNHYLRYRIIPSCYRIHFPEHLKSHRSHDIVLLCVDCHDVAHAAAEKYKRKIAAEFGIPLYVSRVIHPGQEAEVKIEEGGVSPLQLRTAAMALLRHGPRMLLNRREELTEIVKRYYGGREISEEDLERALLVGMSPHERRRFEKKRGFSFRHSIGNTASEPEQENHAGCTARMGNVDESKVNPLDGSYETETTKSEVDRELLMVKDDLGNPSLASDIAVDGVVSATLNENMSTVKTTGYNESSDTFVNIDDSYLSRRQPNGISDLSYPPKGEESTQAKHNSKLSLLGHGTHGKQVVEHLLKEYGEDGVQQFCQRWRQVFVEALNPRFLPTGWDVKHRQTMIESLELEDLHDDLLIEVLCRVPYKYLMRCKCVSKRWHFLISNPNPFLKKQQPWTFMYRSSTKTRKLKLTSKDSVFQSQGFSLSFLPCYRPRKRLPVRILDTFNDLVLCCEDGVYQSVYYVCNPLTMQWVALPPTPRGEGPGYLPTLFVKLVCESYEDPKQHEGVAMCRFKVVRVHRYALNTTTLHLDVFSAETGQWMMSNVVLLPDEPFNIHEIWHIVTCNGTLFALATESDDGHFMVLNLNSLINNGSHHYHFLQLPKVRSSEQESVILKSMACQGCLRLVYLVFYEEEVVADILYIWELKKDYNVKANAWSLVHCVSFDEMVTINRRWFSYDLMRKPPPHIIWTLTPVDFQPDDGNILYLSFSGCLASYDMRNKTLTFLLFATCLKAFFQLVLPLCPTMLPKYF